ncbi:MAG: N-6 DNA methylase [Lentimicrobiaceae bacterium]|jgi:hypothetical protein
MENISEVFARLDLDENNGLFIIQENSWKTNTAFPNRVIRLINEKIEPYAFFCFDNKPLILFFVNPRDKNKLHEAIWNFNESPIVIILENDVVQIFNGFSLDEDTKLLKPIGGEDRLNNFTYLELVTGKTWEQYKDELSYKNRVDYNLLENIKAARNLLVEKQGLNAKITNSLIGKVIFIRYLIDRKVKIKFDGISRTWSNSEFCDLLNDSFKVQAFFNYLDDKKTGFNGDLFPLTNDEFSLITHENYQVLSRLLQGEEIEINQPSLFEFYDFSIIPIEFISNVYELFIGEDNQKQAGAYYTPLFLVDYILKETVEQKLKSSGSDYNCKVLDPACGSGIFLVETLRKIIEKYISISGIEINSEAFKEAIKDIAKQNIYGIDKDSSAVQVAIFSIYLTLLDYLDPPEIETFKFPVLLNSNFFEADFFDVNSTFNIRLKDIEFDFILGNPPWKGNGMDEIGNKYLKNRRKNEKSLNKKYKIAINNNEIAEGFVFRVSDFCNRDTRVSFIVRSSILYNLGYNDNYSLFRQYWLEEYFVDKVFELASVRYEVFEKSNQPAVAPAAVIFYRYANGKVTDNNKIEHIALKQSRFFSLFKIFTINRSDYKNVIQKKLKEYDWLWKVLVYGSYLDFNFIKRLKEEYPSIKSIISNEVNFIEGTGIQYSSNPSYDSAHLIGKPFIDCYGVVSFFIIPDKIQTFEKSKVHRLRDERLFKAPMLLIRKGLDMNTLSIKSAISRIDALFKDSITAISVFDKKDINALMNISAIFVSDLLSYYSIYTFGSIGIEREQTQNYNKFSLPYLDLGVNDSIEKIENAYKSIYYEKQNLLHDEMHIQEFYAIIKHELLFINSIIYNRLKLTDVEKTLIDYALDVNRSLIVGNEIVMSKLFSALTYEDDILTEYAFLFLDRFKSNLSNQKEKFVIEIWHTNQIVGMLFKVIPVNQFTHDIYWVNKQNNDLEIINFLIQIGSEKITEKLFVQKDVRGFEKNGFYIFKPNEKRLWHKAIGYLDVNEFADAIIKEGRNAQ